MSDHRTHLPVVLRSGVTWASGNKFTTQVKVDTGNAIAESDESNNVYSVEISVK